MKNDFFFCHTPEGIKFENNYDFMIYFFCFANYEGPDLAPSSPAFDLDLHCFPLSLLLDAMQKWVNKSI